jgi:hypothetical protein
MIGEVDVDELANFIFMSNSSDVPVDLKMSGLTDARDLFCFCLDLLCKGLILLFGENNRLAIASLSEENFDLVKRKLANVGIMCTLDVTKVETPPEFLVDLFTQNILNIHSVRNSPENLQLNEYSFDLQTLNCIYKIRFDVIRKVTDVPRNVLL